MVWFADLERPRVRANVDQVDLGRVRVGQKARITSNAYRDRSWSAEIEELIPNVVKKQSRFVAEVLAPVAAPATGLLPGMSVDVEIVVDAVPDALQIPSEALFRDEEGAFVYRVDDDRVRVTPRLGGKVHGRQCRSAQRPRRERSRRAGAGHAGRRSARQVEEIEGVGAVGAEAASGGCARWRLSRRAAVRIAQIRATRTRVCLRRVR